MLGNDLLPVLASCENLQGCNTKQSLFVCTAQAATRFACRNAVEFRILLVVIIRDQ